MSYRDTWHTLANFFAMRCYLQILAASCVIVTLLATASSASTKVSKPTGNLIELDEDNWQLMLNGEWMIEL